MHPTPPFSDINLREEWLDVLRFADDKGFQHLHYRGWLESLLHDGLQFFREELALCAQQGDVCLREVVEEHVKRFDVVLAEITYLTRRAEPSS